MKKLISTANLSREEWLKYRRRGIGGSDAAAVCGLNPYISPMRVYCDKTSDEIDEGDNEAMRQGGDLEAYVAQRFCEETGFKVRRTNAIYYDENHPYMLADADRLIVGKRAGLECKTVSPYSASKWEDGTIPMHYQIQCLHYMSVFDMKEWYIAALIFGREFIVHKLTWDDEAIESLRVIERNFWINYVQQRQMPAPDGSEASEKLIQSIYSRASQGSTVPLIGFSEQLHRRDELTQLIQKMDTEKKQIEQELKSYLGESECAEGEGYRVSWKNVVTNKLDQQRLKVERPDIYNMLLYNSVQSLSKDINTC